MHPRRDIERYLAEGLPGEAEQALRDHLRSCAACRDVYDDEVRLRRALAGAPAQPTRAEQARLRRLVLSRSGLSPAAAPAPRRALLQRARQNPWSFALPAAAAALALAVGVWGLTAMRDGREPPPPPEVPHVMPAAPLAAAHLTQGREVLLDDTTVRAGAALAADARLMTGADGLAEVELVRGGRVRLFENTRLKLAPRGESLELEAGKIWCEIESGRGRFFVHTERGDARVLGTSFVVEKSTDGDAEVRVLSGIVEVEDAGHRGIVRVKESQRTRLLLDSAPARISRYDAQADLDDWAQALRKLGRDIERKLHKLGDKLRLP
jgi:hypothetical protein